MSATLLDKRESRQTTLRSEPLHSSKTKSFLCSSQLESLVGWVPEKSVSTLEYQREIKEAGIRLPLNLSKLTGVKSRRIISQGMDPVDMLQESAVPAIEQAAVTPEEIDLVLFSSVSRKYLEPATAVEVAYRLGIKNAICFDVSSACLGFLEAMLTADAMIACGRIKNALIVSAEISSVYIDAALEAIKSGKSIEKNFAALTLGDGSVAAVMTPKNESSDKLKLLSASRQTFPDYYKSCIISGYGSPMQTDTVSLFEGSLSNMPAVFNASLSELNWSSSEIDLAIAHQASGKMIRDGCKVLNLNYEITHNTLDWLGNMASVSLPFTLYDAQKKGRISKGDKIALIGFGSGLGISTICLTL